MIIKVAKRYYDEKFRTDREVLLAKYYYKAGFTEEKDIIVAKLYCDAGFTTAEDISAAKVYYFSGFKIEVVKELRRLKINPDQALETLNKSKKSEKAKTDIKVFKEVFKSKYKVSLLNNWRTVWIKGIDTRVVNWLEKNGFTTKLVKSFYDNKEQTNLKNIFIARFFLLPKKSSKSEKNSKSVQIYEKLGELDGIMLPVSTPNDFSSIKDNFNKNVKILYDKLTLAKKNDGNAEAVLEYWNKKDNLKKLYNKQETIKQNLLKFLS